MSEITTALFCEEREENVLSIKVADDSVIRVGIKIEGNKPKEVILDLLNASAEMLPASRVMLHGASI